MAIIPDDIKYLANLQNELDTMYQYIKYMRERINWYASTQGLALEDKLENKVDKEEGKGLSSNDYTNTDKSKLDGAGNIIGLSYTVVSTF